MNWSPGGEIDNLPQRTSSSTALRIEGRRAWPRIAYEIFSLEFAEFRDDFLGRWPIGVVAPALDIAEDAFAIDDERAGAVADFGVNPHLEGDPVGSAHGVCRIGQQGIVDIVFIEADLLEQELGRPRLVWVDG